MKKREKTGNEEGWDVFPGLETSPYWVGDAGEDEITLEYHLYNFYKEETS